MTGSYREAALDEAGCTAEDLRLCGSADRPMLDTLEKRAGKKAAGMVIVDRGMAFDENIEQIRKRGLHYLVAGLQEGRLATGDSKAIAPESFPKEKQGRGEASGKRR